MRRVLPGMGVVPIAHDKNEDYGNGGGGGGGGGDWIDDNDDDNNAVRRGKLLSYLCDILAVVLMNMGTNCNLAKLLHFFSTSLMVGQCTSHAMYWTVVERTTRQMYTQARMWSCSRTDFLRRGRCQSMATI
jgi:hypothetical protein